MESCERARQRIDVPRCSSRYQVRRLTEGDVPAVYRLCSGNALYYEFFPPFVTEQSIRGDMQALPPGREAEDKLYAGYFDGQRLVAVLDLIDGYPAAQTAWIGFFMTDAAVQRSGVGSRIVAELCAYLTELGVARVLLAWVRDNPQAAGFWQKNGFTPTGRAWDGPTGPILEAARELPNREESTVHPPQTGERRP